MQWPPPQRNTCLPPGCDPASCDPRPLTVKMDSKYDTLFLKMILKLKTEFKCDDILPNRLFKVFFFFWAKKLSVQFFMFIRSHKKHVKISRKKHSEFLFPLYNPLENPIKYNVLASKQSNTCTRIRAIFKM